jgi:hypothetical protein
VAPNLLDNTHFAMERGMRIMNWVQVSLCMRESYQQLRGLSWSKQVKRQIVGERNHVLFGVGKIQVYDIKS